MATKNGPGFFFTDPNIRKVDVNGKDFETPYGTESDPEFPVQFREVYKETHKSNHPECDTDSWPNGCRSCRVAQVQ